MLGALSAREAGLFINLVPVFALAGAYGLMGESLGPIQWLGCGLVLVAVIGLNLGPKLTNSAGTR